MAEQPPRPNSSPSAARDIRNALATLRPYLWLVVLVVVVTVGLTYAITQRQEKTYASSSRVLLRTEATVALFPSASTAPRQLLRVPATEVLFIESQPFVAALEAQQTPGIVPVSLTASGASLVFRAEGIVPADVAASANLWAEVYLAERQQAFEAEILSGIEFLQARIDELDAQRLEIRRPVAALESLIDATADPDQFSRLLSQKVSIEAQLQPLLSPIERQIAEFNTQLNDLDKVTLFIDEPGISARVDEQAAVPTKPVSPNLERNLLFGTVLGLALGLSLPFVLNALHDKVDDVADVAETTGLTVLASIPAYKSKTDETIEVLDNPGSLASERYQGLLTALEFASISKPITSVLVTSSSPAEGKTTTAVNLASLAAKFMNVLLIDADLRRPRLHRVLGVPNELGLSDLLTGRADYRTARRRFNRHGIEFDVLTAGPVIDDHALLLRGDAWPKLVKQLFMYDLIVVDGPPVLAVTDALLIGSQVSAQIVVSRAGSTTREELAEAQQLLMTNGTRVLGVVVNRDKVQRSQYSYYSAYRSAV